MKISNLLQELYSRQNSDFKRHIEGAWGANSQHTSKETPEQIAAYVDKYHRYFIPDAEGLSEDAYEWTCKDESGLGASWFRERIVPKIMEDGFAPKEGDYDDEDKFNDAEANFLSSYGESRTIEIIDEYLKDNPEEFSDEDSDETKSFVQFFISKYHKQAEDSGYHLHTKIHSKRSFLATQKESSEILGWYILLKRKTSIVFSTMGSFMVLRIKMNSG